MNSNCHQLLIFIYYCLQLEYNKDGILRELYISLFHIILKVEN